MEILIEIVALAGVGIGGFSIGYFWKPNSTYTQAIKTLRRANAELDECLVIKSAIKQLEAKTQLKYQESIEVFNERNKL